MPTNTAPESGAPVSSETFVIAHPCKYEVCQRKNSKAANKQLFGLAANGQSSTPNALPRACLPEGLRAVDNFPKLHTRTTKAEDTRAGVRVDSGGKNTAFAQAGNLGWQTYGRCNRRALCRYPRPGFAPAGEALFFVSSPYISPKKSAPEKGDPTGCVPSLRCGQPAVLASSGVLLKLALCKRSNSRKPLSAGRSAPRRSQTGGGSQEAKTPKPETRTANHRTARQANAALNWGHSGTAPAPETATPSRCIAMISRVSFLAPNPSPHRSSTWPSWTSSRNSS